MRAFIIATLIIAATLVVSWGVTVGMIWLLTLCFSLEFSLPVATGIWLLLKIFMVVFGDKRGD